MGDRLKDVGQISTFLFDEDARASIQRLKQATERQSIPITAEILNLKPGDTRTSLSPENSDRLMQTEDFQRLVQILRQIAEASRQQMQPPHHQYAQATLGAKPNPVQISTYLMVTVPESPDYQLVKFISSGFYEVIGDWAGNPIGNLYKIPDPLFANAFAEGQAQNGTSFYTDAWGTWLTAAVPVLDQQGRVVAVIGLDYDATGELNQVQRLQYICFSIIATSVVLSVLVAYLLSRWLGAPITKLHRTAQQVRDRDFSARVNLNSNDELGLLAETFNDMVTEIRTYAGSLEDKNRELETRVEQRTAQLQEKATQLEQTLFELQRTQIQMMQSERMSSLGQLVAGVAHEINNPVNFIHGNLAHVQNYAQNLLNIVHLYQKHYPNPVHEIQTEAAEIDLEFLQADLVKILTSMKLGTDRIHRIVVSLRNFSRIDEAEFKVVNIHEGIDSTLLILRHRLHDHADYPTINMIREYGELPLVECYPGQLNQVFMNILSNAIDAVEELGAKNQNPDWQPTIAIATQVIPPTHPDSLPSLAPNTYLRCPSIRICITDNGCGIPTHVKERIFDPFFTTKPIGKGTGMGLSISYQIITEKHKGKLECFSNSHQGTVFVIQIPIQQTIL